MNRRDASAERKALLQRLGLPPEPEEIGPFHPDAYVASTGELRQWSMELDAEAVLSAGEQR